MATKIYIVVYTCVVVTVAGAVLSFGLVKSYFCSLFDQIFQKRFFRYVMGRREASKFFWYSMNKNNYKTSPNRYYSMYGHVEKLAEEIKKGAASVEGVEAKLWQVPETLPDDVLAKMGAPPKSDVHIITPNELTEADGFIFGFPTRFGMMAAQFKAFLDATGGLWRTQQLAGKPAGIFCSTGSQGGGQETTALTAITQLVHHGMIFVPIGYTFGAGMFEMQQMKGGSPYGAGTFAGDGSRQPSELEIQQAFHQGKLIATVAKKLKKTTA